MSQDYGTNISIGSKSSSSTSFSVEKTKELELALAKLEGQIEKLSTEATWYTIGMKKKAEVLRRCNHEVQNAFLAEANESGKNLVVGYQAYFNKRVTGFKPAKNGCFYATNETVTLAKLIEKHRYLNWLKQRCHRRTRSAEEMLQGSDTDDAQEKPLVFEKQVIAELDQGQENRRHSDPLPHSKEQAKQMIQESQDNSWIQLHLNHVDPATKDNSQFERRKSI